MNTPSVEKIDVSTKALLFKNMETEVLNTESLNIKSPNAEALDAETISEVIKPSLSPLVSITISNYNYGRFVTQAIDSALAQTYSNVEVVVVDDGSTDDSAAIISGYGDRIVSVLKENGGQASAMNAGFTASHGEVICMLDADDVFLPEKVATVVNFFQKSPDIGWVFTESAPCQTEVIEKSAFSALCRKIRGKSRQFNSEEINFQQSLGAGKIPDFAPSTSNLCFSRTVLEKIFPLPEVKGISGMAISDLYIHTLAIGLSNGYFTHRDLGIYRHHGVNMNSLGFPKRRRKMAEKNMTTGYWIQQSFPEFRKISDKFISKGFSMYLSSSYPKSHVADITCEGLLRSYLAASSPFGKAKVFSMILYYWLRLRFQKFV